MGKRGKVQGFSRASARRLRHLLAGVDYSNAVAVTLTHPIVMDFMRGPEAAFNSLNKHRKSLPLRALIWRKEVQKCGTPHYHCIAFPSDGVDRVEAGEKLVSSWISECVAGFGEASAVSVQGVLGEALHAFRDKMMKDMIDAHHQRRRPAICVLDGSRYLRYILDHQSKHKQEQARTEGRAWGVWDRANLPRVIPEEWELDEVQALIARRILRKVTRYAIKCPCSFGWKHTKGRLAHAGVVDYFARCNDGSLASRLLEYLKSAAEAKGGLCSEMEAGRYFRKQFEPCSNI
jgi:hypothetical protein